VLQRLRELDEEAAAAKAKQAPAVVASKDGFTLKSADNAFQIRFRGYTQTDGRYSAHDEAHSFTNTFVMRRVRPILEGTLYKYIDFRVMPDFGQGTATLFDGYVDIRFHPLFALRAGKYKPPVGLERLQSAADLLFVERGFPTDLAPSRDIGVQAAGEIHGGVVQYQAGVFNGAADLGNGEVDNENGKDVAGRLMLQPFRAAGPRALNALTIGVAASHGTHRGSATAPFLAGYRSPLQATVFAYRSDGTAEGTVLASGTHARLYPQGYFASGRLGLMGEYATSEQEVQRDTVSATLTHRAWQLAGSWVLTGEDASYRGVTPKKPFDPARHQWGAFELGARVGSLTIDRDAFPLFADAARSVRDAQSAAVAFNWYLVRGVRIQLNYEQTAFSGGAAAGADRPTEKAVLSRVQFSF
jgi:phosphate-selective porin OprO and OprP